MLIVMSVGAVSVGRKKSSWMRHNDVIMMKLLTLRTTAWGADGLTDGTQTVYDVVGAASIRVRTRRYSGSMLTSARLC